VAEGIEVLDPRLSKLPSHGAPSLTTRELEVRN